MSWKRQNKGEIKEGLYHIKESHKPVNTFHVFFYLNRESLHRERMQEESENI